MSYDKILTVGTKVRAKLDVQGLTKGAEYTVAAVRRKYVAVMSYTFVDLTAADGTVVRDVGNLMFAIEVL
jgi:hypothetical protein